MAASNVLGEKNPIFVIGKFDKPRCMYKISTADTELQKSMDG